jgi:hypothetical protein
MTLNEIAKGFSNWKLSKERIINFAIGISALLVYELVARPYYRPFIYRNNIQDFHIADTIGNSLGTIATIFILIGILGRGKIQNLLLIKIITVSVMLYELAHPLLGKPIDPWDIVATIISGGISLVLYKAVHR